MILRTQGAATYHVSRMDLRDDPRIYTRQEGNEAVFVVCAYDARPKGPWSEVPIPPITSETIRYAEIRALRAELARRKLDLDCLMCDVALDLRKLDSVTEEDARKFCARRINEIRVEIRHA